MRSPAPRSPIGSGAVGVGCQRLRLCVRPDSLAQKQALAAVGQVHLMRYYDDLFTAVDMVRCRAAQGGLLVGRSTGAHMHKGSWMPAGVPQLQAGRCTQVQTRLKPGGPAASGTLPGARASTLLAALLAPALLAPRRSAPRCC